MIYNTFKALSLVIIVPPLLLILLALTFLTIRFLKWLLSRYKYKDYKKTLPNSSSSTILQEATLMLKLFNPDNGLDDLMNSLKKSPTSSEYANGTYGGMYLDGSHCINMTSPTSAKIILSNTSTCFQKLPTSYDAISNVLGDGLVTAKGDNWKIQRRACNPMFHHTKLRQCEDTIIKNTKDFIQDLEEKKLRENKEFIEIHSNVEFKSVTLGIIIDGLFGGDFPKVKMVQLYEKLAIVFTIYFSTVLFFGNFISYLLFPLPYWIFGYPSLNSIQNQIDVFVKSYLKSKKKELQNDINHSTNEKEDLISMLIAARTSEQAKEVITDEMIIANVNTFLFAGNDTTSNLLAWTIQRIGLDKQIQENCHAEVDKFFCDSDSDSDSGTSLDFSKLSYLHATLQEALRMHSPAPYLERRVIKDCIVDDIPLSKGTTVLLWTWAMQMDSRYWEYDTTQFYPDRFLVEGKKATKHPFAYLPFSAGARNCIGRSFALQEAVIILAYLLRDYKIDCQKKGVAFFEGTVAPFGMISHLISRK